MSRTARGLAVGAAVLLATAGCSIHSVPADGYTSPTPAAPVSDHACTPPLCQIVPAPETSASPTTPRVTPTRASRSRRSQPRGPVLHWGAGSLDWAALRQCENGGRYTSPPGDTYRGAYQFDRQTWESVGGTGDPAVAAPAEQDRRARRLYAQRGRQPWPHCGRLL